jgi:hypothetical protein
MSTYTGKKWKTNRKENDEKTISFAREWIGACKPRIRNSKQLEMVDSKESYKMLDDESAKQKWTVTTKQEIVKRQNEIKSQTNH